jgi:hypothetical protein
MNTRKTREKARVFKTGNQMLLHLLLRRVNHVKNTMTNLAIQVQWNGF